MGVISAGCALCRKRRVKCDEGKPDCQRCLKIGKPCPGYERDLKVVFYTDNNETRRKSLPVDHSRTETKNASILDVERSTQPQSNDSTPPTSSSMTSTQYGESAYPQKVAGIGQNGSVDRPAKIPVVPSLVSDIDTRSICLFMSSFVHEPTLQNTLPPILDFLPSLYRCSSPTSCLSQTLSAVAQLNFLNRYHASQTLSDWAKRSYGKALRATNDALSNSATATTDQTLMAVYLLSTYELIVPGDLNFGGRTPWINHVNGTLQLLRMRGLRQMSTESGRQLFRLVHLPILAMTMMMGMEPSQDVDKLNLCMIKCDPENSMGPFFVSKYIQSVAVIRYQLRKWVETYTGSLPPISALNSLKQTILKGFDLEQMNEFEDWTLKNQIWQPIIIDPKHASMLETPAFAVHQFTSTFVMYYWVISWTTRMLHFQSLLNSSMLLQTMLKKGKHTNTEEDQGSDSIEQSPHLDPAVLTMKIRSSATNVVGSVAFAFGDVITEAKSNRSQLTEVSAYNSSSIGAFHLFWPLGAILACPYITTEQKLLARDALRSVGDRFFIVQALKYTEF